jgi:prepilin-type processing-associated H-X9-DG protein
VGKTSGRNLNSGGRVYWLNVLIVAAFVIALFAILFPVRVSRGDRVKPACISNLKQLALGETLYAAQNDDRLPEAMIWLDSTVPYRKTEEILRCPAQRNSAETYGYAMDFTMSGRRIGSVYDPSAAVLLFDSVLNARNATSGFYGLPHPSRHGSVNGVAFVDGHARMFSMSDVAKLQGRDGGK